jgi:hypothetical protein
MKNLKRGFVLILLVAYCLTGKCQQANSQPVQSSASDTLLLINFVSNNVYSNSVVHIKLCAGVIETKVAPVKSDSPKPDGKIYQKPDSTWIRWGSVSNAADAGRLISKMNDTYGDNCYELRSEPVRDKKGNFKLKGNNSTGKKDVYHRPYQ